MPTKKDIKDLALDALEGELLSLGEPAFRAKQIFAWLYRRGKTTFGEFSDVSRGLRDKLEERYFIGRLEAVERLRSRDGVQKFLFRLGDGPHIETVLIPSGKRRTICLSTQAGCKFACGFCASGLDGFKRNLTPSEITGQVLFVKDVLGEEPTNLVFMGMGEPLDNFDNVADSVRIMNAADGMGIAARRITISTCGIVPGIERLAKLDLQVNLSLSLHAVTDRLRDRLMPVNRKFPLEEIVRACEAYLESGGRMMTLEYILIREVNDSRNDAEGLAAIARRLRAKVNLIAFSPVPGLAFAPSEETAMTEFVRWLEERKVHVTRRRSKGADIAAACGQLAGHKSPQPPFSSKGGIQAAAPLSRETAKVFGGKAGSAEARTGREPRGAGRRDDGRTSHGARRKGPR
jgi:23S rRNA (adenine2503-C2)-methyltransferase